jgi:hypothetical protein
MSSRLDLTGQQYGLLVAVEPSPTRAVHWVCKCECGNFREVDTRNLRSGNTRSCGCVRPGSRKHGHTLDGPTPTYQAWQHIKARCERATAADYYLYGGRGIRVCEEWQTFQGFYADMGDKPPGMSIDRIDNEGHYEPANCRWATPQMQANNRRSNRLVSYQGQQFTLAELARFVGLKYSTLSMRLKWGWPMERAVSPTK